MNKILTVSVAAYNVGKYIEKNIESNISSGVINKIEVFVIDDGGTDDTLQIAERYASMYPDSIYAIHKSNGGYGSTVNYSIKHATGKYLKVLDGDDWVDSQGLKKLVDFLEQSNNDAVVTNYCIGPDDGELRTVDYNKTEGESVKKINSFIPKKQVGMWALTLKTEILRITQTVLPEHCLYTDQYITVIPFSQAKTIQYIDVCVYCYRTDRQGQSTERESRIKHVDDVRTHSLFFVNYYEKEKIKKCDNLGYILNRVSSLYQGTIKTMLLMDINKANLEKIKDFENKIKHISGDVYQKAADIGRMGIILKLLRATNYKIYWAIKLLPCGIPNWQ